MIIESATKQLLLDTGQPLHYKEITRRIIAQGLWTTNGESPERSVNSALSTEIQRNSDHSLFIRTGDGLYGLREWNLQPTIITNEVRVDDNVGQQGHPTLSFTDAAGYVLSHYANQQPMHYRVITRMALDQTLIHTQGLTPEATMNAQILTEIKRQLNRNITPRFMKFGGGLYGLNNWLGEDLRIQIQNHNKKIRKELKERLLNMTPTNFVSFIGELLDTLGFDQVVISPPTNDGGIDVRGTLVVGDVIKTRMAIQVKRWQQNVHSPTVQQVRGSLGMHEHGLIITTAKFSVGAIREANRENAVPIALMDGDQLVSQLIENEIGVRQSPDPMLILVDQ